MRLIHLLRMSSTAVPNIAENLQNILKRVGNCYDSSKAGSRAKSQPRLVAVSKTKPKELVMAAYDAGQRSFGENYIQELVDKSNDDEIKTKCPDISWHFIGTCQSNKAAKLVQSSNLSVIETVTSSKLADKLQKACKSANKNIKVMVQVTFFYSSLVFKMNLHSVFKRLTHRAKKIRTEWSPHKSSTLFNTSGKNVKI